MSTRSRRGTKRAKNLTTKRIEAEEGVEEDDNKNQSPTKRRRVEIVVPEENEDHDDDVKQVVKGFDNDMGITNCPNKLTDLSTDKVDIHGVDGFPVIGLSVEDKGEKDGKNKNFCGISVRGGYLKGRIMPAVVSPYTNVTHFGNYPDNPLLTYIGKYPPNKLSNAMRSIVLSTQLIDKEQKAIVSRYKYFTKKRKEKKRIKGNPNVVNLFDKLEDLRREIVKICADLAMKNKLGAIFDIESKEIVNEINSKLRDRAKDKDNPPEFEGDTSVLKLEDWKYYFLQRIYFGYNVQPSDDGSDTYKATINIEHRCFMKADKKTGKINPFILEYHNKVVQHLKDETDNGGNDYTFLLDQMKEEGLYFLPLNVSRPQTLCDDSIKWIKVGVDDGLKAGDVISTEVRIPCPYIREGNAKIKFTLGFGTVFAMARVLTEDSSSSCMPTTPYHGMVTYNPDKPKTNTDMDDAFEMPTQETTYGTEQDSIEE